MEAVEWKEISESPLYEVSTKGGVRRKNNHKTRKAGLNDFGYLVVFLYSIFTAKRRSMRIHRLVATAFLPNTNNYPIVDHINQDRTDNRVENLRWVSHTDNVRNSHKRDTYLNFDIRIVRQIVKLNRDGKSPTQIKSTLRSLYKREV